MTSIRKNYILDLLYTFSGIVFPLLTYPYAARVLGEEGMGAVSFANGILAMFLILSQLGIPDYGIKACAVVREDREKLSRTAMEILKLNAITCFLSCTIYIAVVCFVPRLSEEKTLFLVMGSMLVFNAMGAEWLYRALEQNQYIAVRSCVLRAVVLVLVFLTIRSRSDYVLYGGLTVLALSGAGIINFINLRRHVDLRFSTGLNLQRHWKMAGTFMAMSVATTIYSNMDTVMLGFMKSNAEVGYYDVTVKVKGILVTVILSLGRVLLPRLSLYFEKGERKEFDRITRKAMHFILLFSAPLSLYFILQAKPVVLLLGGSAFLPGMRAMQILMPVLVLIGMTNVCGIQIMVPQGMEKYVLYSELCGVAVNLGLNAVLIPRCGVDGAAAGTLCAELTVLIFQLTVLREQLRDIFASISPGKLSAALLTAGSVAAFVPFPMERMAGLALSFCLYMMVYGGVLLLLKENFVIELWKQLWKISPKK